MADSLRRYADEDETQDKSSWMKEETSSVEGELVGEITTYVCRGHVFRKNAAMSTHLDMSCFKLRLESWSSCSGFTRPILELRTHRGLAGRDVELRKQRSSATRSTGRTW